MGIGSAIDGLAQICHHRGVCYRLFGKFETIVARACRPPVSADVSVLVGPFTERAICNVRPYSAVLWSSKRSIVTLLVVSIWARIPTDRFTASPGSIETIAVIACACCTGRIHMRVARATTSCNTTSSCIVHMVSRIACASISICGIVGVHRAATRTTVATSSAIGGVRSNRAVSWLLFEMQQACCLRRRYVYVRTRTATATLVSHIAFTIVLIRAHEYFAASSC